MDELMNYLRQFNSERDWDQFHSPNNLAKSIVLEANELLEHFQFDPEHYDQQKVCDELADVMTYCLDMCDRLQVDPLEIIYHKMAENERKYPADKCRGLSDKYTAYKND